MPQKLRKLDSTADTAAAKAPSSESAKALLENNIATQEHLDKLNGLDKGSLIIELIASNEDIQHQIKNKNITLDKLISLTHEKGAKCVKAKISDLIGLVGKFKERKAEKSAAVLTDNALIFLAHGYSNPDHLENILDKPNGIEKVGILTSDKFSKILNYVVRHVNSGACEKMVFETCRTLKNKENGHKNLENAIGRMKDHPDLADIGNFLNELSRPSYAAKGTLGSRSR